MVDPGSLLNNMPLSTLEAMEIPPDMIVKRPVEVLEFGGNASFTLIF